MGELFRKVTAGKYPPIPKHFSNDLSKLIGLCLNTNPALRPTAEELLATPPLGEKGKKDKDSPSKG